jgi:mRNA-degrading endonuclease RelE of RelBE toxin-antitoxin system
MSYKVVPTPNFVKELKPLIKKYPSLRAELIALTKQLETNPLGGGVALGKSCYKIRLAIGSKRKGKSGGARVITYVYIAGETVFLISIYDKADQADLNPGDLDHLMDNL